MAEFHDQVFDFFQVQLPAARLHEDADGAWLEAYFDPEQFEAGAYRMALSDAGRAVLEAGSNVAPDALLWDDTEGQYTYTKWSQGGMLWYDSQADAIFLIHRSAFAPSRPKSLNIPSGLSDTLDEVLDPSQVMYRESTEEVAVKDKHGNLKIPVIQHGNATVDTQQYAVRGVQNAQAMGAEELNYADCDTISGRLWPFSSGVRMKAPDDDGTVFSETPGVVVGDQSKREFNVVGVLDIPGVYEDIAEGGEVWCTDVLPDKALWLGEPVYVLDNKSLYRDDDDIMRYDGTMEVYSGPHRESIVVTEQPLLYQEEMEPVIQENAHTYAQSNAIFGLTPTAYQALEALLAAQ